MAEQNDEKDDQKGDLPSDLQKVQTQCNELIMKLQGYISKAVEAGGKLNDTNSGIANWLGNHVFRTDNPERLQDAKDALQAYQEACQDGVSKANQVIQSLNNLGLVQLSMSKWKEAIKALFPVSLLKMTFPDIDIGSVFNDYKFNKTAFDAVLAVEGVITLALTYFGGFAGLGIGVAIMTITALIGGIIAGEENKKLYENMKDKANAAKASIDEEVIKPLDETIANIAKFWVDVGTALATAGYIDNAKVSQVKMTEAIKEIAFRVEKYSTSIMMFNDLTKDGVDSEQLTKYATVAAVGLTGNADPPQSAINEFKLVYYMNQKDMNLKEIAAILNISEEDAKKLQAKQLLDAGKTPAEIAKELNMSQEQVDEIQMLIDEVHGG